METHEPIGSRLAQVIAHYGLHKSSFSAKIGLSNNSSIVRVINDKERTISFEVLHKIGTAFPELEMNWLVMGIGPMFKVTKAGNKVDMFNIRYFGKGPEMAFTDLLHITGYQDCDSAYTDVIGDYMAPKFVPGDVMVCKKQQLIDMRFGEAYRITTDDMVMIRYVIKTNEDHLVLACENSRYPEASLPFVEIEDLHLIRGIVRRMAL